MAVIAPRGTKPPPFVSPEDADILRRAIVSAGVSAAICRSVERKLNERLDATSSRQDERLPGWPAMASRAVEAGSDATARRAAGRAERSSVLQSIVAGGAEVRTTAEAAARHLSYSVALHGIATLQTGMVPATAPHLRPPPTTPHAAPLADRGPHPAVNPASFQAEPGEAKGEPRKRTLLCVAGAGVAAAAVLHAAVRRRS
eukprot:6019426-Prymnesium_polylepis.2